MKLNTIKTAALALALSVSAAGTVALAQSDTQQAPAREGHGRKWGGEGHRRGGEGRFGRHGGGFFGGIELTDAQKTQMRQIHESHRAATSGLRQEVQAKRQELRQLTSGATFDEGAVRAKLTEIAAVEAKLLAEQFRMRQESQAILTPEQKTQLEQRRQEFKQRFEERRERRAEKTPASSAR
jgi:periplasmic protein CpxP/Spy